MGWLRLFADVLAGRRKTAIFSVTNLCNCRCSMCDIPDLGSFSLTQAQAKTLLHDCYRNGVRFVSFTGGEPLIHPGLREMLAYAKSLGMYTHLATNGTVPRRIREVAVLADLVGFSLDSHVAEEHDANRRHPGCAKKVRESIAICKGLGVKVQVNTPPNTMIADKPEEYVSYVTRELGVSVGFCYPGVGGVFDPGENTVTVLTPQRVADFFAKALELKDGGSPIANTRMFLMEAVDYALGRYGRLSPCTAGEDVVWVDWSGMLRPCFVKEDTLNTGGSAWRRYDAAGCNDCFIQCFREPSIGASQPLRMVREWRTIKQLL